uniref:Uncharacterized protein n=1 Tax=Anopheles farauti TaxID=69004 RepID=A0A182QDI9_9DIPT
MRTFGALLIFSVWIFMAAAENAAHGKEKRAVGDQAGVAMEKIMEKGMIFAGGIVDKLKNNEVARNMIGKVLGALGDKRGKRSIQIDAALTNYNLANYQKVELHKTLTNDARTNKPLTCPIGQNELNWLERVVIAMQHALGEMNKIINGQKVGFNIPKPASA